MPTRSTIHHSPLLLAAVLLISFGIQITAAETISTECLDDWGFSGVYPGMPVRKFHKLFPEAVRVKRPWREKLFQIHVENPIIGINTGPGEMLVSVENRQISTISFAFERTAQFDALLHQLKQNWGKPFEGIVDSAILRFADELKDEEASGEIDTGFIGTRTLVWPNDCSLNVSLYLRDRPNFWVTEK